MAIKINQHEKKWRIEIVNEIFQFEKLKEAQDFLNYILDKKDKFAQVRN